jgi:hypothetical protein
LRRDWNLFVGGERNAGHDGSPDRKGEAVCIEFVCVCIDGKSRSTRGAESPANRRESPLVPIDADRGEIAAKRKPAPGISACALTRGAGQEG